MLFYRIMHKFSQIILSTIIFVIAFIMLPLMLITDLSIKSIKSFYYCTKSYLRNLSSVLFLILLTVSSSYAQSPVSCGTPFYAPKSLGDSSNLGQDLCKDGSLSPLRSEPVICDCQITCDFDDGSRRTICNFCPGSSFIYEGESSKDLCASHGGIEDSQWFVTSFFQQKDMWQGPESPLTAGSLPGPDKMTCDCLSGPVASCVDAVAGPQIGDLGMPSMCHDVCGWEKGSLSNSMFYDVEYDALECSSVSTDKGPEVHCTCNNIPESNTWCTDDITVCTSRNCEVHHTAPSSLNCLPLSTDVDKMCVEPTASGALKVLNCAVGNCR